MFFEQPVGNDQNIDKLYQMGSNRSPGLNNRQNTQEIQRVFEQPVQNEVCHIGNNRPAEPIDRQKTKGI